MTTARIPPEQWSDPRHRDGFEAEVAAGRWLQRRGWHIEVQRFRMGHHDIDLVARRDELVAFIEVKARHTTRFGGGEEAVGARKRHALERSAWCWILRHGRTGDQYRFDVIVLEGSPGAGQRIRHLEDAWRPGWR